MWCVTTDEIQPRMRRLVALLQSVGFQTTDSGDGVTNVEAGMEDALDFPHVFMTCDSRKLVEEARRLLTIVRTWIRATEFQIECTYSPVDDTAVLALYGLTDDDLPT